MLKMNLKNKHCVPCEEGGDPMSEQREDELIKEVPEWTLVREGTHKITRLFKFKNFIESMAFVNRVAKVAEEEGHHPDIKIVWNKVQLDFFTHAVGGLHENDFVMASKVD